MSYWRVLAISRATWRASSVSSINVWTALGFGWAGLADFLQGAIARRTFAGWAAVRVRVVAAELLEGVTFGADVLVVIRIPFEVSACPSAVVASGLSKTGICGAILRFTVDRELIG